MHFVGRVDWSFLDSPPPASPMSSGLGRTVLVGTGQGATHTELAAGGFQPGGWLARHIHSFEEALYVLDGEVAIHIGDDVINATAGSAFYFPAGTREFFEAVTQATVLAIYTPGGIDKFFVEVAEPAATRTLPPPSDEPPDFERIVRVTAEYGMNIEAPPA